VVGIIVIALPEAGIPVLAGLLGFSSECVNAPQEQPHGPTAEENLNKKPLNERPSGQQTQPGETPQPGTQGSETGPSNEPPNTNTTGEPNPQAEAQAQTGHQPTTQPSATNGNLSGVTRNAINDAEYSQAKGIADHLGGKFEGRTVANEPGIDGTFDGIPASLKEIQAGSANNVRALANTVTNAVKSAGKANYSGVWLFIRCALGLRWVAPVYDATGGMEGRVSIEVDLRVGRRTGHRAAWAFGDRQRPDQV
jgi:hypothetical protein